MRRDLQQARASSRVPHHDCPVYCACSEHSAVGGPVHACNRAVVCACRDPLPRRPARRRVGQPRRRARAQRESRRTRPKCAVQRAVLRASDESARVIAGACLEDRCVGSQSCGANPARPGAYTTQPEELQRSAVHRSMFPSAHT
eukprot:309214-Chlamydomonas_euryale.AAC.1